MLNFKNSNISNILIGISKLFETKDHGNFCQKHEAKRSNLALRWSTLQKFHSTVITNFRLKCSISMYNIQGTLTINHFDLVKNQEVFELPLKNTG